jgi:SAM-dependent methyltransferase
VGGEETRPHGEGWEWCASLDGYRAVLDPRDDSGARNLLIHQIHVRGLRWAARHERSGRYEVALDGGCGIGRMIPVLLDLADRVVGVDANQTMLERARALHAGPRTLFTGPDFTPSPTGPLLVNFVYVLAHLDRAGAAAWLARLRATAPKGSRCVLIERVVTDPSSQPEDIPPREADWYADLLDASGWKLRGRRRIRRAASLPLTLNGRLAPRLPAGARPALATTCARLEYALAGRSSNGAYSDLLMWADA